jgi:hypothetical protein
MHYAYELSDTRVRGRNECGSLAAAHQLRDSPNLHDASTATFERQGPIGANESAQSFELGGPSIRSTPGLRHAGILARISHKGACAFRKRVATFAVSLW